MPLSHYPKTVTNLVLACVHPAPPFVPPPEDLPDFLGRPFSELNLYKKEIAPKESVIAFHDAQPFTRFYGSIACDQPLDVSLSFSNNEVDDDGNFVSDDNIGSLHYDALGVRQIYDPSKQDQTGKFFSMIFGRWIRVEIRNTGDRAPTSLRFYLRGSVF